MSYKQWGTVAFASILASPILLAISMICLAVVFIIGYVTLAMFGLVSAVIYGAFGMFILWGIGKYSKSALKKYSWLVAIVPIGFVVGLVADNAPIMQMSMLQKINTNVTLVSNEVVGNSVVTVVGPYLIATFALILAMVALLTQTSWFTKHAKKLIHF